MNVNREKNEFIIHREKMGGETLLNLICTCVITLTLEYSLIKIFVLNKMREKTSGKGHCKRAMMAIISFHNPKILVAMCHFHSFQCKRKRICLEKHALLRSINGD